MDNHRWGRSAQSNGTAVRLKAENWLAWALSIVECTGAEVGRIENRFAGVVQDVRGLDRAASGDLAGAIT